MWWLYRLVLCAVDLCPRPLLLCVARPCVQILSLVNREDRRVLVRNLKALLPEASPKQWETWARQTQYNFARYFIDLLRSRKHDDVSGLNFEAFDPVRQAQKEGKGVVVLTAHLGHWELGGFALGFDGFPVHAVALSHANRQVDALFCAMRERWGLKPIALGRASRECLRVLRSGEVLALVADRVFDAREKTLAVSLGEGILDLPRGPFALAFKTGAALVPAFLLMKGEGYTLESWPVLHIEEQEEEAFVQKAAQAYADVLAAMVRRYPDQWFVFRNGVREYV